VLDQAIDRGLEGVVACSSGISTIAGTTLLYRGYAIEDLAENASFEEVVHLLWHGALPSAAELESLRNEPVGAAELERAKEHVKGRTVLLLESTSARMSRNANATLFDLPLLSIDEIIARIDAVTIDDVAALAAELYAAESISAACIGADEDRFRTAVSPVSPALVR